MRLSRRRITKLVFEICGEPNVDIEDAMGTAELAHLGQTRRSGEAYIEHPKEVAKIVYDFYKDPLLCAAALLHDSLEDAVDQGNFETVEELEAMISASFGDPRAGDRVLRIVQNLTHAKDVPYDEYVSALLNNQDALRVKMSDMLHNLRSSPSPKQKNKYSNTLRTLQDASGGMPPGITLNHWKELQKAASDTPVAETRLLRKLIRMILG
jgi:(p)ppGpp synthase/HD superfamily hydrolase